jgi:hypothetical protein
MTPAVVFLFSRVWEAISGIMIWIPDDFAKVTDVIHYLASLQGRNKLYQSQYIEPLFSYSFSKTPACAKQITTRRQRKKEALSSIYLRWTWAWVWRCGGNMGNYVALYFYDYILVWPFFLVLFFKIFDAIDSMANNLGHMEWAQKFRLLSFLPCRRKRLISTSL